MECILGGPLFERSQFFFEFPCFTRCAGKTKLSSVPSGGAAAAPAAAAKGGAAAAPAKAAAKAPEPEPEEEESSSFSLFD